MKLLINSSSQRQPQQRLYLNPLRHSMPMRGNHRLGLEIIHLITSNSDHMHMIPMRVIPILYCLSRTPW